MIGFEVEHHVEQDDITDHQTVDKRYTEARWEDPLLEQSTHGKLGTIKLLKKFTVRGLYDVKRSDIR